MRQTLTVLLGLLFVASLAVLPAIGFQSPEPAPVVANPETVVIFDGLLLSKPTAGVSSCREPSPCQTHADCDYPHGVCLPDFGGGKSCACLPDNF